MEKNEIAHCHSQFLCQYLMHFQSKGLTCFNCENDSRILNSELNVEAEMLLDLKCR